MSSVGSFLQKLSKSSQLQQSEVVTLTARNQEGATLSSPLIILESFFQALTNCNKDGRIIVTRENTLSRYAGMVFFDRVDSLVKMHKLLQFTHTTLKMSHNRTIEQHLVQVILPVQTQLHTRRFVQIVSFYTFLYNLYLQVWIKVSSFEPSCSFYGHCATVSSRGCRWWNNAADGRVQGSTVHSHWHCQWTYIRVFLWSRDSW